MEKYIGESLPAGLIHPSSSLAGAGFFFVRKKDGSLRPCIDYRGLNDITVKNRFPIPLISSAFNALQKAQFFTKLDLRIAYHLVRIKEGDEWKTAFNKPRGHYEYLVMPFGLKKVPTVFQALVHDILRDVINRYVFVYLDDILIFSETMGEHVTYVRLVLQRLLENRLFTKAEKCTFHRSPVQFLGFVVARGKLEMDPVKTDAVMSWPRPTNRKELKRFLAFANFYRQFIRGFSSTVQPLTALTSMKVPFLWSPKAEFAFTALKVRFSTAPILVMPKSEEQFILKVNASDPGAGAVLSQRASDGKVHPCAYFSRRLSPAERNYALGDRELLALKLALEEWRHLLEGSMVPFIVWTDHRNLEYLRTTKCLNPRQARWSLLFNHFNFTMSYRPGSRNVKPDALSRLHPSSPDFEVNDTIPIPRMMVAATHLEIVDKVERALAGKVAVFCSPRRGGVCCGLPCLCQGQQVFRLHGIPLEVTSDRGPQFTSTFWKAFCTLVGAKPQLSSGFHPQTNGQTERLNQELEKFLRCLVEGSPNSWVTSLP